MAAITLVPDEALPAPISFTPSEADDPKIARLYALAKGWATQHKVSAASVVTFTTYLISAVEQLVTEGHAGAYKKLVVMTVLRRVVANDIPFADAEDKAALLGVVELVVPRLIDTIIGVATGSIDIGKIFGSGGAQCCFARPHGAAPPNVGPSVPAAGPSVPAAGESAVV